MAAGGAPGRRRNKRARQHGLEDQLETPGVGVLLPDVVPVSRTPVAPTAAPDDESRRVLLPPRDEQTAWAMAHEGVSDGSVASTPRLSLVADGPLVRYIARAQLKTARGLGTPAPLPLMLTLFSERFYRLAEEAAAAPPPPHAAHAAAQPAITSGPRRRFAEAHAPVANYRLYAPRLRAQDAERLFESFYADDAFDEESPYGLTDPHTYPMFRELVRNHQESYQARERLDAGAIGDTAHVTGPQLLPRAYFTAFRMPPPASSSSSSGSGGDGTVLLCANGRDCLFMTLDPSCGYIGRAFLLPDGTPATPRGQAPLCIDCLLFDWKQRVMEALNVGHVPPEPINTFCVYRGVGEYDEQCLLRQVVENRPTGIAGDVPMYHRMWRSYEPITPAQRQQYGLARSQIPSRVYLAEVFTDFRQASAAPATLPSRNS